MKTFIEIWDCCKVNDNNKDFHVFVFKSGEFQQNLLPLNDPVFVCNSYRDAIRKIKRVHKLRKIVIKHNHVASTVFEVMEK